MHNYLFISRLDNNIKILYKIYRGADMIGICGADCSNCDFLKK